MKGGSSNAANFHYNHRARFFCLPVYIKQLNAHCFYERADKLPKYPCINFEYPACLHF